MRFYVLSVLPDIFESFGKAGIFGKACQRGLLGLTVINPRDFTEDKHRTVDDTPYGGGNGMVMLPGPVVAAMEDAESREAAISGARPLRIVLTPQGEPFTQALAHELSRETALTLVCGRYEGIDERAVRRADREISIGDYVLMGGEVGAMALMEAVGRLRPHVLGNPLSTDEESHSAGLLEYPQYTRPPVFRDDAVPPELLSGHHAEVRAYRRRESLRRTLERRPELLEKATLDKKDRAHLAALRDELDRQRAVERPVVETSPDDEDLS